MLNKRKIRLMFKLADYEKDEGKNDIKLSRYYKNDYVRVNILKTAVSVTVGYLFVLLLAAFYKSEYLIANAVNLDYKNIGTIVLGVYIMFMTVYITGALVGYSLYYDYSRRKLSRYFNMLKRLKKIYREENEYITDDEEDEVI